MDSGPRFEGRIGLQQRVLPAYRIPFVDRLAQACQGGLEIFVGSPAASESILWGREPEQAELVAAHSQRFLAGPVALYRQPGLQEWIAASEPDVLILEANPRYLSNWAAARQAGRMGVEVLAWGLGAPGAVGAFAPLARPIWRRFLRSFDALIAYSSIGAAQYQAASFPGERITVALNAVVDGPTRPIERQPAEGRPLAVLFVGRLQKRKRVDLLIQAAVELGREVEVRIVGDGPARAELEAQAAELLPAATFSGAQQGRALSDSFAWADLFVLPGTGGLAVQQAMAYGLPVIVAEGDGTEADLVRPENGWLVSHGSASALTAALRQAASDPEGLLRKGQASRRIVEREANLDSMVVAFLDAIERGRTRR